MALSKERVYYKAVRQAITALGSGETLKEKLDTIARLLSRSFDTGASIVLLDSTRKHLIHAASWKLPPYYLRKGLMDARKSLSEVEGEKPVFIEDVSTDTRIQYREMAEKAGIKSILGVPVTCGGEVYGAIRVYFKEVYPLTNSDTSFTVTLAHLAALALCDTATKPDKEPGVRQTRADLDASKPSCIVHFAHESEAEFARILDFYGINWIYEPRSFPLVNEKEHASGTGTMKRDSTTKMPLSQAFNACESGNTKLFN